MSNKVTSISDLQLMFHRNERPIYFISATNFNLLGMDRWVNRFRYINYIDCFDGRHPNVFVPQESPHAEFESIEDINNYLLQHKDVIDMIERRGGKPVATFLMFDEKTESLAKELGMEVWFPPAALRTRCDNKMETVRIGNKAGVHSVPNALEKVDSYAHLMQIADRNGLGRDLVVQSAFGDSGHTTFFIASEDDFNKHKDEIVNDPEVKIMKRINCRGATLEACATQSGTLVGPLLTEVVGARADPQGRLVRQRGLPRRVLGRGARQGARHGRALRQPAAGRGLSRLLRPGLPDRHRQRRGLSG